MAFRHAAGTTTPGAPDEVVDWFAAFEILLGSIGWIIASGAGTTDLVIRSLGEGTNLNQLYLHLWRDLGNPSRVRGEVQDDLAGTHVTTSNYYVDSGGAGFSWWMSGDKDSLAIVFKTGVPAWRFMYLGLVMPFIAPVDETYHTIMADRVRLAARILHRYDGAWDQADQIYGHNYMDVSNRDRNDASLSFGGCYYGGGANIAGQLKHVSYRITDPATSVEDTITSTPGDATTWIVMQDTGANLFALRTGGKNPVGLAESTHFTHEHGLTTSVAHFFDTVLPTFLTGIGWVVDDMPASPWTRDKRCYSTGESGTENIWVRFIFSAVGVGRDRIYIAVMDDAVGTHTTTPIVYDMDIQDFPTEYWISADRDCFIVVFNRSGQNPAWYGGMLMVFAQGLPDTTYKVVGERMQLRDHAGLWNQLCSAMRETPSVQSSPNRYDGTYPLWEMLHLDSLGAGRYEVVGQRKFFAHVSGGISPGDVIRTGEREYTVFYSLAVYWALRTA